MSAPANGPVRVSWFDPRTGEPCDERPEPLKRGERPASAAEVDAARRRAEAEGREILERLHPPKRAVRRPVTVDGMLYRSVADAARAMGTTPKYLSDRLSKGRGAVKVADGRGNANYRFKHLLVYEEHHGAVPEGCRVVFADRDRTNLDPANLVAVPKRLTPRINSMSAAWRDADTLRAIAAVAELQGAVAEAEKSVERECRECGAAFRPEFGNQVRCRACIDARKEGR